MAVSTVVQIKGEDRTQAAFRQVQKNIGNLNKSVSGLKAGLVSLVGTAGFGALSKSLIDTADQLGKTSARLGVSTKNSKVFDLPQNNQESRLQRLTWRFNVLLEEPRKPHQGPESQKTHLTN